jgi:glutamate-1-semialdehyde 2,1-aminomutase
VKIPGHWNPTDPQRPSVDGPKGEALRRRADKVMPSYAMFLTRSARYAGYHVWPGFISEAEGCRVRDVDGHSYIDFSCSNGPNLLGYRHPELEAAARSQAAIGDLMPNIAPSMIDFCERLLRWTDGFAWALPLKRGSDSTELAMRVARAATGHPHVVMFAHSYYGSNKEQSVLFEGVPPDALAHVSRLPWNDAAALDNFRAANGEPVAAILMSPLDQPGGTHHTHSASKEFVTAIHRFRQRHGAAIILDDIRAGFRLHPQRLAQGHGAGARPAVPGESAGQRPRNCRANGQGANAPRCRTGSVYVHVPLQRRVLCCRHHDARRLRARQRLQPDAARR